jgi:hypothetical protein
MAFALLVLPGLGQCPCDRCQCARLRVLVGDRAGDDLGVRGEGSGVLVLPGKGQCLRGRA